ncbi:hypothetical protein KSP39_PZI012022 [Platanthera zijinensis]|uniref:Calcium uniporter protein C-terminal domain-containing protein n=1 Tax=Platanthera zijinensis TaxID=2320716 RepID=A0AAP0G4H5_9ASPA
MALRNKFSGSFLPLAKYSYIGASIAAPPPNERHDLRRFLPSAAAGAANRRILLQHRSIFQSGVSETASPPLIRLPFPPTSNLIDRIRSSMMPDQIRRDSIAPPPAIPEAGLKKEEEEGSSRFTISVADARKLLNAPRIEKARARLKTIQSAYIGYPEFLEICRDAAAGSEECAREISSALDRSGAVVVLSNIVFLRPEQVARAIESAIISRPVEKRRTAELKEMEARKSEIDMLAEGQVKRELWAGLGLILIQTAGFMRLTFWELSWDVMEPICFFTTSIYFILGYFFFLRTAREPSFEGFFAGRFAAKQRRLMKLRSFDLSKFNDLTKDLSVDSPQLTSCGCHCRSQRLDTSLFGAAH